MFFHSSPSRKHVEDDNAYKCGDNNEISLWCKAIDLAFKNHWSFMSLEDYHVWVLFKVIKINVVWVHESVENECTFLTLAFIKSKIWIIWWNSLIQLLKYISKHIVTLDNFPYHAI